jgi:hypothetical protein
MNFNDLQVSRFATRPKDSSNANDWSGLFNPANEDTLRLMFRGKNEEIKHSWQDDELAGFPPGLTSLWSSLFAPVIGRRIEPEEIPAVLSCASQVSHPKLVLRCLCALESIAADDKLDVQEHRLFADAQRVLEEVKAKFPDVAEAREASREKHSLHDETYVP